MSDTDDGMVRADRAYLAGRRAAWADDNGRHRPVCDLSGLEALWWRRGYSAVRRQMRDGREIGRLLNYAEKKRQWAVAWRKAARMLRPWPTGTIGRFEAVDDSENWS